MAHIRGGASSSGLRLADKSSDDDNKLSQRKLIKREQAKTYSQARQNSVPNIGSMLLIILNIVFVNIDMNKFILFVHWFIYNSFLNVPFLNFCSTYFNIEQGRLYNGLHRDFVYTLDIKVHIYKTIVNYIFYLEDSDVFLLIILEELSSNQVGSPGAGKESMYLHHGSLFFLFIKKSISYEETRKMEKNLKDDHWEWSILRRAA